MLDTVRYDYAKVIKLAQYFHTLF